MKKCKATTNIYSLFFILRTECSIGFPSQSNGLRSLCIIILEEQKLRPREVKCLT